MLWVDEPDLSDETGKVLVDALANSFSSPAAITDLATEAGLKPADIPLSGSPRVTWAQLVRQAHEMALLRPLVEEAARRIPASNELRHVLAATVAAAVPGRIFISYRRQEASAWARLLQGRLAARLGEDQVFMDVDTMVPGVDFAEVITRAVSTCPGSRADVVSGTGSYVGSRASKTHSRAPPPSEGLSRSLSR
jgi:Effector-associated domain 1